MANSQNTFAGKPSVAGGAFVAPLGTDLPTDASTVLTGFTNLGFVSEDGLSEVFDRSTDVQKDWNGDQIRVLQTEVEATFEFALLEVISYETLCLLYGKENVTKVDGTDDSPERYTVKNTGAPLEPQVFVWDMSDQGNRMRIIAPNAQVTAQDDITYSAGELASINVTVSAFKDTESGAYTIKYIDKK